MSDQVLAVQLVPESKAQPSAEGWGNVPTLAPPRTPFERPLAALRRYKWLCIAVIALSTAGGFVATKFVIPDYEVRATIWIQSLTPQQQATSGPIKAAELLNPMAWVGLLKSYRVTDAVVRKLALYVKTAKPDDRPILQGFAIADRFLPGTYTLNLEKKSTRWKLSLEDSPIADSGSVGDSIGRPFGLRWRPDAIVLKKFMGSDVKFSVATPRETSVELNNRLTAALPPATNFLSLGLTDPEKSQVAVTLNAITTEYVKVATELKKINVVQYAQTLESQLQFAETTLKDAETALETFKIHTITLPSEGGPVVQVFPTWAIPR